MFQQHIPYGVGKYRTMIDFLTVETSSLGDRSYLAHDGEVAVVVDPQRDIDRVLALAREHELRIAVVLETHVHNDYVSGAMEVRAATGADLCLPARGGYAFFDPSFDPTRRAWLPRPCDRLFFAGEHTSQRWQGYMNGAVESGRRAAAEIEATHRDGRLPARPA